MEFLLLQKKREEMISTLCPWIGFSLARLNFVRLKNRNFLGLISPTRGFDESSRHLIREKKAKIATLRVLILRKSIRLNSKKWWRYQFYINFILNKGKLVVLLFIQTKLHQIFPLFINLEYTKYIQVLEKKGTGPSLFRKNCSSTTMFTYLWRI